MFTGLIKEQGKIVKIIKSSHSIKLTIQVSKNMCSKKFIAVYCRYYAGDL